MALFWISLLIVGVVTDSLTSGFLFPISSLGIILNLFNLPRYLQFIICLIVSIILTLTLVPYVMLWTLIMEIGLVISIMRKIKSITN